MKQDLLKVLITKEQIEERVKEMGKKITQDYQGDTPVLVSILKGSVAFMADLMRQIEIPCEIDFMSVSSYGTGTKTSGVVKIIKDLDVEIEGRQVLIIEDILDSGMTLNYISDILRSRNPKSIELCTLLDKPERREIPVNVKYTGFVVPDEFVVGYGLDFNEKYRNLPYIGVLKPEKYQ